ncbi:transcription termination factor NusB [Caldicoprobacter guelmensis]|uniref:flagellar export chaperone FlgN n=1 Tax=Caldicoprobacter guelmensis TaxID=1170224 RepID=UPI001958F515|nr:flagellar export chaperone FlgN [Caldicoprobacter guelmensis]MBM7582633.1 transcription termination factor NusB [Caldicoprobacter guelmensis]
MMESNGLKINERINEGLKRLIELAELKKQHMHCILELTRQQSEVLSAEQVDQLLKYIQDKQEHIDAIKALDEEFSGIFGGIKKEVCRDGFKHDNPEGYGLYVKLRARVSEIKDVVEAIYSLEVQNQERVRDILQDVKARISNINRGKRGYSAYKQQVPQADGVFIDQRK